MSGWVKDSSNPFDPLFDVFAGTNISGVSFGLTKSFIMELVEIFKAVLKTMPTHLTSFLKLSLVQMLLVSVSSSPSALLGN